MKKLFISFLFLLFHFSFLFAQTLSVTIWGATLGCSGAVHTLCANATGGSGGNTYTWQPGGDTGQCITVSPTVNTTYTVTVVDNSSVSAIATTTVQTNPYPNVAFSADVTQGCTPICIQFYNNTTISSGSVQSCEWAFGNGDTALSQNPIYCYPDSGSYSIMLTVVSDSGCGATLTKVNAIRAYGSPGVAFVYSPQPASILDPTIQFTGVNIGTYPISYWYWSFGDNSTDTVQSPTHTYHDTGTFCVNLRVLDIYGCTDTTSNYVHIANEMLNFNMYSNLGNGTYTLQWFMSNMQSPEVSVSVSDEYGHEVYKSQMQSNAGFNSQLLNLENLASGIYFIRMQTAISKSVQKFIISSSKK